MSWDVNGSEITYCHFFTARIQCDLGTKIRVMDNTHVILRGAEVAGILETDPGMTGLKECLDHLLPER
jgi:hypothetical protein